ncbi:hypothetical protein HDU96_005114, partial [Phlyctochytrium bullatum]
MPSEQITFRDLVVHQEAAIVKERLLQFVAVRRRRSLEGFAVAVVRHETHVLLYFCPRIRATQFATVCRDVFGDATWHVNDEESFAKVRDVLKFFQNNCDEFFSHGLRDKYSTDDITMSKFYKFIVDNNIKKVEELIQMDTQNDFANVMIQYAIDKHKGEFTVLNTYINTAHQLQCAKLNIVYEKEMPSTYAVLVKFYRDENPSFDTLGDVLRFVEPFRVFLHHHKIED